MLWTILAVLVVLWLLGFVSGTGGALIHLLLLIAGIVLVGATDFRPASSRLIVLTTIEHNVGFG